MNMHKYHFLFTLFVTINITTNVYTMDAPNHPIILQLPKQGWQEDVSFINNSYAALEHNFNLYQNLLPNQKWPTETGTLNGFKQIWLNRNQDKKEDDFKLKMVEYCLSTQLVCTPDVLKKTNAFLIDKKEMGSDYEKALYKGMELEEFVARQFIQRIPVCYNPSDVCLRLGDEKQMECGDELKRVGSIFPGMESSKFPCSDVLTPDERHKVAPYLLLSCKTPCINKGDRDNEGKLEENVQTIEQEIVYIAGIGARYEDPEAMDCLDLVPRGEHQDGDIKIKVKDLSNNIKRTGKTRQVEGKYFRPSTYKNRMLPVIQAIFDEAQKQAQLAKKKAYLHMVALGLGVWELFNNREGKHATVQTNLFLEDCKDCLENGNYPEDLADIDFSWFHSQAPQLVAELQDNTSFKDTMIHFSKRNPADKLTDQNAEKLPVAVFAWDSMSAVGNEFYIGGLSASGDPAAASATLIAPLMNPYINPFMVSNIIKAVSENNTSPADVNATFDQCTKNIQRMITVATARKQIVLAQKAAEAEKLEQERLAAELATAQEAEKLALAEQVHLALEKAKQERLALQKAREEKAAARHAQKEEAEKLARAEQVRLALEAAEREKAAKIEQERLALENAVRQKKAEAEKQAQRAEQERLAAESAATQKMETVTSAPQTPAASYFWERYISTKTLVLSIVPVTAVGAVIAHYLDVLPTAATEFFNSLWNNIFQLPKIDTSSV